MTELTGGPAARSCLPACLPAGAPETYLEMSGDASDDGERRRAGTQEDEMKHRVGNKGHLRGWKKEK